jgi:MFS family permease
MSEALALSARPRTPAPAFLFLLLPFGISGGYVSVTLVFLLAKAGMPTAEITLITALGNWPQMVKFLWAPLIDTTLNAKAWYVIGSILTGLTILALSAAPATVANATPLIVLVSIASLASTLVSQASEIMMAHGIADERKGAVSGWSQAGGLGGAGIGGGIGVLVAEHVSGPWISGAVLAVLCVGCCGALFLVDEPAIPSRPARYVETLKALAIDVWDLVSGRAGMLVFILMLLPIGSGGAQGEWAAIAGEWRCGADIIALVTGVLSGLVTMVGCLAAGYVCDRLDRRTAYCLFGVALAVVAVVMALSPRSPAVFIVATLAYAFVLGACYSAYSATVLEAIGKGAAATKFNIMAAISNVPINFMNAFDGSVHDRHGTNGMLFGEAGLAVLAVVFFMVFSRATRGLPPVWRWFRGAAPAG